MYARCIRIKKFADIQKSPDTCGRGLRLFYCLLKKKQMTLAPEHNCVPLIINSPWETISGFNLTAVSREKRQGMKLCSGIRKICDSS